MVRRLTARRRRAALDAALTGLARFFDDNLQALLFIGFVFLLGVLVGLGWPRYAGAAEPKDSLIASLDSLDVPAPEPPLSEVLFLSITHTPDEERAALWLRLAQAEVRLLQLEERLARCEAQLSKQKAADAALANPPTKGDSDGF